MFNKNIIIIIMSVRLSVRPSVRLSVTSLAWKIETTIGERSETKLVQSSPWPNIELNNSTYQGTYRLVSKKIQNYGPTYKKDGLGQRK